MTHHLKVRMFNRVLWRNLSRSLSRELTGTVVAAEYEVFNLVSGTDNLVLGSDNLTISLRV